MSTTLCCAAVLVIVMMLLVLLLLLQQTVNLEPIRSPSVSAAALGHSHEETLAQTTSLARGSILLVDDALAIILALRDRGEVVVGPTEERLEG